MNSSNGQNEAAGRDYFFRPENMKSAIKTNTTTMATNVMPMAQLSSPGRLAPDSG
jgi:hypothetical protein